MLSCCGSVLGTFTIRCNSYTWLSRPEGNDHYALSFHPHYLEQAMRNQTKLGKGIQSKKIVSHVMETTSHCARIRSPESIARHL